MKGRRPEQRRVRVQLFESPLWVLLTSAGLLLTLWCPPGEAAGATLTAYAVGRFALEGLRGDARRFWGGVSQSRWMSAPVLVLGLALADRERGLAVLVVGLFTGLVVVLLLLSRRRWLPPSGPLPLAELEKLGQAIRAALPVGDSRELRLGAWTTAVSRRPAGWALGIWSDEPPMGRVEATLCLEALALGLGLPILDLRPRGLRGAVDGRWSWARGRGVRWLLSRLGQARTADRPSVGRSASADWSACAVASSSSASANQSASSG